MCCCQMNMDQNLRGSFQHLDQSEPKKVRINGSARKIWLINCFFQKKNHGKKTINFIRFLKSHIKVDTTRVMEKKSIGN